MRNKTADRVHFDQLADGPPLYITSETYSMKPGDTVICASGADNTVDITLPSYGEAAGNFYYIEAIDVSNDVSILIKETATELATYGDLDTQYDHVILFCTGRDWRVVLDGVA